ncbi:MULTISPECIES: hypothetical protein [unclassified Sphingobacterium]|uniref:hypothetical protein n=1 Tax=unclassified Sphingobacterium TaxID=2609468 RepID=UPI001049C8F1|nr:MULTISPECIES: hypothetical protein [unclassified Sphingobacterium]MCS3557270.1 hypothetical protein [Sphingobacterium sp. JUb21]TCQ96816.1 hypothetical protein EDF66_12041 [Sphingobacterium sp. JUb20]
MSTFDKFKKAVREAYLEKKSLEVLPDELNTPSPANLREYSLIRLHERLSQDDINVFKNYFSRPNKDESIETAINNADLSKLRSLQNFIIGETLKPSERIVKMVAILIDFPKRPYKSADWIETNISGYSDELKLYERDDVTQQIEAGILEEEKDCEETVIYPDSEIKREEELVNPDNLVIHNRDMEGKAVDIVDTVSNLVSNKPVDKDSPIIKDQGKYSIVDNGKAEDTPLSGDNLFGIKGLYGESTGNNKLSTSSDGSAGDSSVEKFHNPTKNSFFLPNRRTTYLSAGAVIIATVIGIYYWVNKECMCWNGIRYIEVECRDNKQPNQIIGLNEDKLNNFEKIMKPDTLTKADVGKVWYSKIDNEVEFFTHSGKHPIHINKSLKAATEHIINTWAGRKSVNLDNKSIEALP